MKRVYLIRHAQPHFPGGQRMCLGRTDIPLGEEGRLQAQQMAASLPAVTAVFSSPLSRAVQTAEAIGLPVTVLENLRELDAGEWDGLTFEEIRRRYPRLYAARGTNKQLPLPGSEDENAGLARFCRAMEQAAEAAPGDFAVVAHGGILARFLENVTGLYRKPDYVEVMTLVYDRGRFSLQEES